VLWLIVRLISGAASAFVLVFMVGFASETFARVGRPHWSGWFFSGVGLGIAASSLLVWGLAINWRGLWLAAGDLAAVLALIAWYGTMRLDLLAFSHASASRAAPPSRLFSRAFVLLVGAYGCLGLGYIIHATYLPTLVRGLPQLAGFATLAWLVVGLAAAPSNPFWDWIARRVGRLRAMAAAFVLQAVGLLVPLVWVSVPGVLIAALALGGTFMGITALGLGEARAVAGAQAGRAVALMTASFGLGQIAGPPIAAALAGDSKNFLWPTVLASAVLLLGAALSLLVLRLQRGVAPTTATSDDK
jgi:MFS family permease